MSWEPKLHFTPPQEHTACSSQSSLSTYNLAEDLAIITVNPTPLMAPVSLLTQLLFVHYLSHIHIPVHLQLTQFFSTGCQHHALPCDPGSPEHPEDDSYLKPKFCLKNTCFSVRGFSGHSSHASPTITCHQVGFLPAHILHYTYYLPYEYLQGNFDQNNRQQNTSLRVMKKTYNMTGTVSSTSVLTIPLERGV